MSVRIDPAWKHQQFLGVDHSLFGIRSQVVSDLDDSLTSNANIRFPLLFVVHNVTAPDEEPLTAAPRLQWGLTSSGQLRRRPGESTESRHLKYIAAPHQESSQVTDRPTIVLSHRFAPSKSFHDRRL